MQNLIATTSEVVHYIALQAVHYKPLQEVHLSRYNQFNIALMDNNSLREMTGSFFPNGVRSTKSVSIENTAVKWIKKSRENIPINESTGEWSIADGASIWYVKDNVWDCIAEAINNSESSNKEWGGYGWDSDVSGVLIDDPRKTSSEMHFHWIKSEPYPSFDFHVHPNGNKTPSEYDMQTWYKRSGRWHYIFDTEWFYSAFYI